MSLILLLAAWSAPTFAQDEAAETPAASAAPQGPTVAVLVADAKKAILAKDYKGAEKLLDQAEAAAPTSPTLVMQVDLARIPFYRGLIEYRVGDKDTKALNLWRDAIVLMPDFQPEKDVLPETDGQDVFYALAEEAKGSREQISLGLPEDPGDASIFVSGKPRESFDTIYTGRHFVQIRCAEGNVVGAWYTYGPPPPDYLVLCSGGSYPAPTVAKEPKDGRKPRLPKDPSAPKEGPNPMIGYATLGTGVAMLAGGTAVNFLVVNPAWSAAQEANEDPGSVSRSEADEIIGSFNTGRYATIGLIGVGALATGAGFVLTPMGTELLLTPGGLLVQW